MSIGLGIFLIALGAILSFAISDALPGVNLEMIGWILMAAGLATTVISVILMSQRRTVAAGTRTTVERDGYGRP